MARLIVVRRLERGPRTRAQLKDACTRRGVPEWAVDEVLDRFGDLGLVDDEAFASAWVESRHAGRGLARRALRHELTTRGVDREVIDQALAQVDPESERAAARALVDARLPGLARVDRATRRRRLHGVLGRRGYSAGLAASVIAEALGDDDESGDLGP